MSDEQFLPSFEGTWARLSQVAVNGAEYNSRERQPHPKCLEGTRVDLLTYIYESLDDPEKNRLIWLHGTAGVGKSAVAFTVAERMKGLKVTEETNVEKRLGGTFFFSRKHTKRCTAGYFFMTLAYQLATNFPSIRKDVNRAIRDNPALLDPDKSLYDQMEALFLQPLRKLQLRLRGCPPLTFVVDALDECTSEPELTDLILSLARALREPDLPVTHILLTSRPESHIRKAFQNKEVQPLLCEIPVKTSGEGVISLDGADVDKDIYIFLQHSFAELASRHTDFPQPSKDDLAKLASRAGRRFIVASTMMKFIVDNEDDDPHSRLQLMLKLTSELLPGTEVYRLYDCILSTCANPERAYIHLSIVAALADPLPISQISSLLGPGLGRDVQTTLIQLRSVMDIPTDGTLPVNIYHSSIRDYVFDPSHCSLPQVREQNMPSPHSLLADSSFHLMMKNISETTALLDALSELEKQSQAMQPEDPDRLKVSLSFLVQSPEPLSVLICMLWLRGDRASDLQYWLGTVDGYAWVQTTDGRDWLQTEGAREWVQNQGGQEWLQTWSGQEWLQTEGGREWLNTEGGRHWVQSWRGREWLQTQKGYDWLQTEGGREWLQSEGVLEWLQAEKGREWLQGERGRGWLQTWGGRKWLQTEGGRHWVQTQKGYDWLQTWGGRIWLQTWGGRIWLQTEEGREWRETEEGREWPQTWRGRKWLQGEGGREWLQTWGGRKWLQTEEGRHWVQTQTWYDWLQTEGGREWLQTWRGRKWLQTEGGRHWLQSQEGHYWLQTEGGREWLQTEGGRQWLQTEGGRQWLQTWTEQNWLQTEGGPGWLQTQGGQDWLQTEGGQEWLQTWRGRNWLQTEGGRHWLQSQKGHDWLQTEGGREWLQTEGGREWLQTEGGREWLQTEGGREWLQTEGGPGWLQTEGGLEWLQTQGGSGWLQTQGGQDWLQTQGGQDWLQTWGAHKWLQTKEGLEWLKNKGVQEWLQTCGGRYWLQTWRGREWRQTEGGREWLQTQGVQDWLQTQRGQDLVQILGGEWLQTQTGYDWLQAEEGRDWLQTLRGREWLQTWGERKWLHTEGGRHWLQTEGGRHWLQTEEGRHWLQTEGGLGWLQTQRGLDWLQTPAGGRNWLQTLGGRNWLQTLDGQNWLQTLGGRNWLQTLDGRNWLQTPHGQAWQSTPAGSVWANMEEFSSTLETISNNIIVPNFASLPTFKVVQQLKSLPDFLMFPMLLALIPQDHSTAVSPEVPDREIIRAMNLFIAYANEAQERSQSSSDALKYASQNWVVHMSRAPHPWDDTLNHIFRVFWNHHLLSWLERQWCLKGLRSCLDILSAGQELAKVTTALLQSEPSAHILMNGCQPSIPIPGTQQQKLRPPFPSPGPNTAVLHVGTSRKRTSDEFPVNSNSALELETSTSLSKRRK